MAVTEEILVPLLPSLKVAGVATALVFVAGVASAWWLARSAFPGKEFIDAGMTLPMVMPPTVLGCCLLVMVGRRGIFGEWLYDTFGISLVFTWQGAALAAAVVAFALVYKAVRARRDDMADFLVSVTSIVCIVVLVASGRLLRAHGR